MTDPAAEPSRPPGGTLATQPRHTHALTPLIQGLSTLTVVILAALVLGVQSLLDAVATLSGLALLVGALLLAALVGGLIFGLSYLAWRRTEYFFDDSGDFRVDHGVLSRSQRRVTLSRLQAVDVTRPLLGRIFGMAQVRIDVAGGGDSKVVVQYLTDADARALRAEIIARAAGVAHDAGEAPEVVLASVPTQDLAISLLLRSETVLLLLVTLLIVGAVVLSEGPMGLLALVITGGVPLLAVFGDFTRHFGFTVAESPDGLRLRSGLLRSESQTVPPGRVQAIEVVEPILWRRRGWVRIRLNVAGRAATEGGQQVERVLLPVAPQEVAQQIVARVLPGIELRELEFTPAPRRSRRRAWLQWRNLGIAATPEVFATRRGFLTTRTAVIPHARTQSVRVTQGPWQRRLALASVHVDSTPGPVTIVGLHRDAGRCRAVAEEQLVRAARARRSGPPARWLAGGPSPGPHAGPGGKGQAPTAPGDPGQ